ncbi:MAG TPA: hypothetical protein VJH04_00750 [archaeon]|nr:hypothetical protein [archaeon]
MAVYKGQERRSGKEFRFRLIDPDYIGKVERATGFQFYSDPHFHAWLGHAEGNNDRHFVPLRGKEPRIESSGCLTPASHGGLPKNAAGQADNRVIDSLLSYDNGLERYSREVFPDRRAYK